MSTDENYDLSPDKRTLRSLKSDVTPIAAVKELVDNVIDNWQRLGDDEADVTIDIDIDAENDSFRIEDNSGGLAEENVKKIFALGGTTKEEIPYSIGSYGMGAKKAIVRLGERAIIRSRSLDSDRGYGFEITEEWLNQSGWGVEKQVFEDQKPGSTIIEIQNLNIEFRDADDTEGEDDEELNEGSGFDSPQEFIEGLREDLAETYSEFLSGSAGPEYGKLSIKINGRKLESSEDVSWSFTPYDGFHPRIFQEYTISPDELPGRDEPVKVDVAAGIMPTGDMAKSGTDVFIQNRKILTANKGEMGGWGVSLNNHIDNIARVKLILKIYAENNPEDLPWDTQKSRVELNNNIAERAFHFLGRAGEEYAVRYDDFRTPFSEPYGEKSENLSISEPEELDYSTKTRVVDKPNSDTNQADQLSDLVSRHIDLAIYAPHLISDSYNPSYKPLLEDLLDDKESLDTVEDLWEIPGPADEYPERKLHLWLEVVKETAERHVESGRRISFEDNTPWWRGYYNRVRNELDSGDGPVEANATISEITNTVETRKEEGKLPELILESSDLRGTDPWSVDVSPNPDDSEEETSSEGPGDEDTSSDEGAEDGTEDGSDDQDTDDIQDESTDGNEDDSDDEEESEGDSGDSAPDFGGTVGRDVDENSSETRNIVLPVSPSTFTAICEDLGLDSEEVTARDVGEELLEQSRGFKHIFDSESTTEAE